MIKYWSMVSIHPYRETAPETVLSLYHSFAVLFRSYNSNVPIIAGEWGYTTPPMTGPCLGNCARADLSTQAKYLTRMWLLNTMNGNPISIWYDFSDDGPRTPDAEYNFGTLFQNLTTKPSYLAASTLQWTLGNGTYLDRVPVSSYNVFILRFLFDLSGGRALGYGAWTNVTTCIAPRPRMQCGALNISLNECLLQGCCYDETVTQDYSFVPRCYVGGPPTQVSFDVGQKQCFKVFNFVGRVQNHLECTSSGRINIWLTDGPTYLVPVLSVEEW
eukprot:TRINITY_DN10394_c1_g3_i1.p1 TRINITY_DN10394_c1_g3~~TRINITY_DN10394_c1_g3_i1.p1  ORF type:complete len:273 (-),score=20.33 TRINITY_DN10394_c1_g3_i1:204-1022(-)